MGETSGKALDGRSHPLAFATDGSIYGALAVGDRGWGNSEFAMAVRWDATGKPLWKRTLKTGNYYDTDHVNTPATELWSTFRNNVGVVYGNMVALDYNVGHTDYGGQAKTYVWDRDGLWVGGLFDAINTGVVGKRWYNLSSDTGSGAVYEDSDGSVVYLGATEGATHVYRITGWKDFARASGVIQSP